MMYTAEEIDKMYEALNLPNIPNINKADFLEYSLHFGTNLERYEILKNLKSKDMSWKDFKDKELHNIRVRDIDIENGVVTLGHTTPNITKNLFSKKEKICR